MANNLSEVEKLRLENQNLKSENDELKERLKKYTAPARRKTYYENHKDELIQKSKVYSATHKPSEDKKREYNQRYYLKKKEGKNEDSSV